MNNFLKETIMSFLLLLGAVNAYSYIAAADLRYECQGTNYYLFSLDVYYECSGGLDAASSSSQNLVIESEKLGVTITDNNFIKLTRKNNNIEFVSVYCENKKNESNCYNGSIRGLEKVTFDAYFNFAALDAKYGKTDDWRVHWTKNYRSQVITSTNNSSQNAYYVETIINTKDFSCNNSPTFTNKPPTITANVGEENTVNLLISDSDGDELTFEIISPRISEDVDLPYKPGFSETKPFTTATPITISSGGILTFTPTKISEIAVFDILVTERRDGKIIGQTSRAIQVNTFDPTNTKPELSGFNGDGVYEKTFCAGVDITPQDLFINGLDEDERLTGIDRQSITFEVINNPGFGYNLSNLTDIGQKLGFNWTTGDADVGTHKFSIRLKDDGCPIPAEVVIDYVINITERPQFELGQDFILECNDPAIFDMAVTDGTAPYSYTWGEMVWTSTSQPVLFFDTLKKFTTKEYQTNQPQIVSLIVEDVNGCFNTDVINLQKNLSGKLEYDKWCFGKATTFNDNSNAINGNITRHDWYYGDGNEKLAGNTIEQYTYPTEGDYDAFVIIEDEFECIDTLEATIDLCTPPKFEFITMDDCNNHLHIIDNTNYGSSCAVEYYSSNILNVNGKSYAFSSGNNMYFDIKNYLKDQNINDNFAGIYQIEITAKFWSGCEQDTLFDADLIISPTVELKEGNINLENFSKRCNDPDTTLKALLEDPGHGGLTWNWDLSNGQVINDTAYFTNQAGFYQVTVTDSESCSDTSNVLIDDNLEAKFSYDMVCTQGDPFIFHDSTNTDLYPNLKYKWDFGDGITVENITSPTHTYIDATDHEVTLTVSNIYDCEAIITQTVYNTYPDQSDFNVSTDASNTVLCARNDTLIGISPFSSHTDTIIWNTGEKEVLFNTVNNQNSGQNYDFTYSTDGTFDVSVKYLFNYNYPVSTSDTSCPTTLFDAGKKEILPAFDGYVETLRKCVGDSAEFKFTPYSSNVSSVTDIIWTIHPYNETTKLAILSINEITPKVVFNEIGQFDYVAQITDDAGCNIYKKGNSIRIPKIWKAEIFVTDTSCANEFATFEVKVPDKGEVVYWGVVDDELKTPIREIGNYNAHEITGVPEIKEGIISYKFSKPGLNKIRVFMEGAVFGEPFCYSWLDTTIYVAPIPEITFTVTKPVCAVDSISLLSNSSTIDNSDEIKGYLWDFGDETTSTEENPEHIFQQGGFQSVSLTVFGTKCSNTKTSTTDVYVKHKPTADFTYDESYLEAYIPISFTDNSTSGSPITSYFYDFGDGTTSDQANVDHEYDTITVYQVKHIVINDEGCSDTIIKRTDLNTYLDIPTAFSPNGDGNNDIIGLVHKSIKDLTEYKIYNRWGQVVFDGGDNPDLTWDGTFNGSDQELGVYVVIVKGTGAYDTPFEFKKNITLLR